MASTSYKYRYIDHNVSIIYICIHVLNGLTNHEYLYNLSDPIIYCAEVLKLVIILHWFNSFIDSHQSFQSRCSDRNGLDPDVCLPNRYHNNLIIA